MLMNVRKIFVLVVSVLIIRVCIFVSVELDIRVYLYGQNVEILMSVYRMVGFVIMDVVLIQMVVFIVCVMQVFMLYEMGRIVKIWMNVV